MTHRSKWGGRARQTLDYQKTIADWVASLTTIRYTTPVELTARFYVRNRAHGDLKNYLAAVEDGLQYAGVVGDDKQIVRYGVGTGIYVEEDERVEIEVRPADY